MLFNSWSFLVFLWVTLLFYYLPLFKKLQIHILIAASFLFYGWFQPWLLSLLLVSIFINSFASFKVSVSSQLSKRKKWATLGIIANLSILIFFKYLPLIASTIYSDWKQIDSVGVFVIGIPLPIGISFFTFQGISLVVDVFKEKEGTPNRLEIKNFKQHLFNTAFFKSFFPQLVSGPIVKAHDFYFQIRPKFFSDIPWERCARELILGYFLKCVVADNMKDQTFSIAYPYFVTLSSWDLAWMLFGYTVQIFADFAGYSLIALGIARLFGYDLPENFNRPYISTSFSEFWRRWHISLSSFLKEYLYIPLGGNRYGELRTYFNLFIVMFLGGLWHGAAWSYAIWGTAHGAALAIERLVGKKLTRSLSFLPNFAVQFLGWLVVFSVVSWAWLLFKLPHFADAILYMQVFMKNTQVPAGKSRIFLIVLYSLPVIFLHAGYLVREKKWAVYLMKYDYLVFGLLLFLWVVNSGSSGAFIYFQF